MMTKHKMQPKMMITWKENVKIGKSSKKKRKKRKEKKRKEYNYFLCLFCLIQELGKNKMKQNNNKINK